MIKTDSYQKTKTSSSEYYFDTDNIMALKDNKNQASGHAIIYILTLMEKLDALLDVFLIMNLNEWIYGY